jgi:hypothetical protein
MAVLWFCSILKHALDGMLDETSRPLLMEVREALVEGHAQSTIVWTSAVC